MSDYRKHPHWERASDGAWAVCIPGKKVSIGSQVIVRKADGDYQPVTVTRYREKGINGHLYSADTSANDRMNRAAELNDFTIDTDNQSGRFAGRGSEVYFTTTTNCTCKDFLNRGEPCKHMYRLDYELRHAPISIDQLNEEIKPKSHPILYRIVAFLFGIVALGGAVVFIYAIIHGTTGEIIFGAVLTIICTLIGSAAFSVSKEAKAHRKSVIKIEKDEDADGED